MGIRYNKYKSKMRKDKGNKRIRTLMQSHNTDKRSKKKIKSEIERAKRAFLQKRCMHGFQSEIQIFKTYIWSIALNRRET